MVAAKGRERTRVAEDVQHHGQKDKAETRRRNDSNTRKKKMDNLLIHRCTLKTRTQDGEDAFGNPIWIWTDQTNVKCRFVNQKGGTLQLPSGEYVTRQPKLMLKQSVNEEDIVTGTKGFIGDYNILKVYPRYDSVKIHHYEADLERKAG